MNHTFQHHFDGSQPFWHGQEQINARPFSTLAIPLVASAVIACTQIIHGLVKFYFGLVTNTVTAVNLVDGLQSPGWIRRRVENMGGWHISVFIFARLVGCLVLLGLSLNTTSKCEHGLVDEWCGYFVPIAMLYSSLLAAIPLMTIKGSTLTTRCNNILLLVTFGTYAYRDLWPLATYSLEPEDINEGDILWAKVGILFLTAVIIPLFIPRRYTPVDPNNPMPVPNKEQTCSIFSFATFSYLDHVVFLAAHVAHLKHDQLPPLSDTDYTNNLVKESFPHLDIFQGAKRRHLFISLLRVFRKEFIIMTFFIIVQGVCGILSPLSMYKILQYLETGSTDSDIRPWVWILCVFLGPFGRTLTFQWYIFFSTRSFARGEALLTHLIFEHSLRIRLKADNSTEIYTGGGRQDGTNTPHTGSVIHSSDEGSGSITDVPDTSTMVSGGSTTGSQTKSVAATTKPVDKENSTKKGKHSGNLAGKINNLVTTDLDNILEARDFLMLFPLVPILIGLCTAFLYQILGWSAFCGLASMVVLFPVPGYIAKLIQDVQRHRITMTDARVQHVTEAVSVIRMVKLFGWEGQMSDRIKEKRDVELRWLRKLRTLEALNGVANFFIPAVCMVVTYATYTIVMKEELSASKIFTSISIFSMLRIQLNSISWQISTIIQGKVSLERVQSFLHDTEVLDSFLEPTSAIPLAPIPHIKKAIGFNNATFSWSLDGNDGALTPTRRNFKLCVDGELIFKPNCINLIVGPTGSGKSSMLMALLGEMHFIRSGPDSWFNLPRDGGVAYAAQESWVLNETIRDNILFGSRYNETRYRKVIRQCALERDLELFEAGDSTEVGEKGLTLSGGQKARVTLARAIYSPAKIILLDDVLAALDVHTSATIVNQCFRGDLIKDRTVLLVTHNLALTTPIASRIISLGLDGSIRTQDKHVEEALQPDPQLAMEGSKVCESTDIPSDEYTATDASRTANIADGKLIVPEEIAEGRVTWRSMKLFLGALGGDYPLIFFSLWMTGFLFTNWGNTFQTWFLGYWASKYEDHPATEVNVPFYLAQYTAILTGLIIIYTLSYVFYVYGSMRASKRINNMLVNSILGSTLRWLDETPTARMISRCTQDIRAVDGPLPQMFAEMTEVAIGLVTKLGIVIIFTPLFFAPGVAVAALGLYLGKLYIRAQLSARRELSNARSPVLAHFSAAVAGIVSIRAYGAEVPFKAESVKRIDHFLRIARVSYNLNRWIGTRIDSAGALFFGAIASYLVYGNHNITPSNSGFTLNMCIDMSAMILLWVRIFNEFEVQSNSLERIQHYIDIEHEPAPVDEGIPPAAWPTSGQLRVENLCARYSQTGPNVLHNLTFNIQSGERIGIVGRTGSGKSSLTLALLRCIITEGTVYYDGLSTNTLNLDALRSNITIIPQMPELISGTLRRNLDPFEQHDDSTLNTALRDAGLFALQEELDEGRITLDSSIASGGGNLSVGQRQIIALARAMVRGSKLLILDEATSAIDYKTDSIIQATLRTQLAADVTLITVAHRLQTIMDYDKIMVLDAGRIVEFDTPATLLRNVDGILKSMVDGSGDRATLYALAKEDVAC